MVGRQPDPRRPHVVFLTSSALLDAAKNWVLNNVHDVLRTDFLHWRSECLERLKTGQMIC